MKPTDYAITIVWSEDDQAYLARVPSLPGCVADGKTREEAVANAVGVIQDWIDTAKELGRPVPSPLSDQDYHQRAREIADKGQALFQKAVNDAVQKALSETEATLREELSDYSLWAFSGTRTRTISESSSALIDTSQVSLTAKVTR